MIKEFKEFLLKQNAIALAIGVIIGAAVGKVVSALVDNVLNPLISLMLPAGDWRSGGVDPARGMDAAGKPFVTKITYGQVIGAIVDFVIIGLVVFLITKALLPKPGPAAADEGMPAVPGNHPEASDPLQSLHAAVRSASPFLVVDEPLFCPLSSTSPLPCHPERSEGSALSLKAPWRPRRGTGRSFVAALLRMTRKPLPLRSARLRREGTSGPPRASGSSRCRRAAPCGPSGRSARGRTIRRRRAGSRSAG